MKTGTNSKKPKKVTQIAEAAETLFVHHGIKRVTVEEICRISGVSKMTFYKYFPNKIELVKYIWKGWVADGFDSIAEIEALDLPFPGKIHRMFQWRADLLSKMHTENIEAILPIEIDQQRIHKRSLSFIVDAQRKGEIRPTLRPELVLAAWDKLVELGGDDSLRLIYPDSLVFRRELKDFFWFGVLTGKYASI